MRKYFVLFFALSLLVPSVSSALPGLEIDISAGISQPKPSGSIKLGSNSYDAGSNLNLSTGSDLFARVDVSHEIPIIPNIYVHHLPVEVKGTDNLGQKSEIKILQDDVGLYYHLPLIRIATDEILDAKLGLNVRFANFSASTTTARPPPPVSTLPFLCCMLGWISSLYT
jgi:hypothetical protein